MAVSIPVTVANDLDGTVSVLLNTGHGGSMSTVHADTAAGALSRPNSAPRSVFA